MKRLITGIVLLLAGFSSAQVTQELRKELNVKDNGVDNVEVLGDKGIVVYGYVNEKGAPDNLQIRAYTTNFEEITTVELDYPKRYLTSASLVSADKNHLYFFYQMKNMDYRVIDYNAETHQVTEIEGSFGERISLSIIRIMQNKLFLYGHRKGVPIIMVMDPKTGRFTFNDLPGENKKRAVESMVADSANGKMAVFYRDGKSMKTSQFYVSFFDIEGDLLDQPLVIDRDENFSVIDGSITWLSTDQFIISGTYGLKNTILASGIYFSQFKTGVQQFITYHTFTEFDDFFTYLPARQQARIERKKKRKKNNGKEDFVKCLVEVHPIVIRTDDYLFVGEVYYPTYRTEMYTTYVNGRPVTQTRQVFDGYQYSHAVVAGIDKQGQKIFDKCFSMYLSIKPYSVVQNIHIANEGNTTKLFYSTGSSLKSAIVSGSTITQHDLGKIVADQEGDNVRWTSFTRSQYWYDNYYIVYGSQQIKNNENEKGDRKRTVFFLSKILFKE